MADSIDNRALYDANWQDWADMKRYGPASRWLRCLVDGIIRKNPRLRDANSLLDVGCGEGTMTCHLAQKLPGTQVLGVDFSRTGIDAATVAYRRANLAFRHDEANHCLGRKYDIVTCFEVLEHIDNWQPFLTGIAAAAETYILLSFPTGRMRAFERNVGHFRNFAKGEVELFLQARGFVARDICRAGFPFFSPLYRDLCNLTNAGSCTFTRGAYGVSQRCVGTILLTLFRCSSRRRWGDQFCGLFERQRQD